MKHLSKNISETREIAEKFIFSLDKNKENKATVVALYGDLGSAKTTFTQAVAGVFGVSENVTSPTFVIEKIYELKKNIWKHLIHIDAYRLEKEEELINLGWNEIIKNNKNIIMVEWPERISNLIPKDSKKIFFTFIDEETREIDIV